MIYYAGRIHFSLKKIYVSATNLTIETSLTKTHLLDWKYPHTHVNFQLKYSQKLRNSLDSAIFFPIKHNNNFICVVVDPIGPVL
jgi:hypothetical protein